MALIDRSRFLLHEALDFRTNFIPFHSFVEDNQKKRVFDVVIKEDKQDLPPSIQSYIHQALLNYFSEQTLSRNIEINRQIAKQVEKPDQRASTNFDDIRKKASRYDLYIYEDQVDLHVLAQRAHAAWRNYRKQAIISCKGGCIIKDVPIASFATAPSKNKNLTDKDWIEDKRSWTSVESEGQLLFRSYDSYAEVGEGWRKEKNTGRYYIMLSDLTRLYLKKINAVLSQPSPKNP